MKHTDRFREQQDALNRTSGLGPKTTNLHISSKKTTGQRGDLLREFVVHGRALMTNARCLTEGVDVPAIDCVMFADPKQSRIDIVQAAGRALRHYEGKVCGYIVVPLIVPEKMDFNKFAETTAFRQVAQTITALSTQDERIADEFRAIEDGRVASGKILEIEGDIPVGLKMKLGDFAGAISTRVWENVGRANWAQFEDARDLVRGLRFTSVTDWRAYCQSGKKPADIPTHPHIIYSQAGWVSWGDWLGTRRISDWLREHRPFKKAREFARSLNLKSETEWRIYCRSRKLPNDIPKTPAHVYAETGWAGMGDWLGTGRHRGSNFLPFKRARAFARRLNLKSRAEWVGHIESGKLANGIPRHPNVTYAGNGWADWNDWLGIAAVQIRSFHKARSFARSLGLKSSAEWSNYCNSGKKPEDIPAKPYRTYANDGWSGMGDWLGTGRVAHRGQRPFKEARDFVRRLGLKSSVEWLEYCRSSKKPADIPANPNTVYAGAGWFAWADWLGAWRYRGFGWRPFANARAFVHSLQLKSHSDWISYCASGAKPIDIPSGPSTVYREDWSGWNDWLNTGRRPRVTYLSFEKARTFVRSLNLRSRAEWDEYCKGGKKPDDVPRKPERVYAKAGWRGVGNWLGTGTVAPGSHKHRSFKQARIFVHSLNLKSVDEWRDYCKSGKKPPDIPVSARSVYGNDGWIGWGDWLGTGRVAHGGQRPFKEARNFVRSRKLKNEREWRIYCQSGKKPADIPATPANVYGNDGWIGWGDWLGTGRVAHGGQRPFKEARDFVRRLGLKSSVEWLDYCRSGKRPGDIPSNPYKTYAKSGWVGMGDWLGTGTIPPPQRQYQSFKKARAFVHGLGLKSENEWREFCRSGKKLPCCPVPDGKSRK
jgi:hypothetical protein